MLPKKVNFHELTKPEIQQFIADVETIMLNCPQIDAPIAHHFSKDIYAREMKLEKGGMVVGKIHRYQNLNILSEGEVTVVSIDGVHRIKAPFTFVASAGVKRLIYAHENATWTVVHGTSETDLQKIEDEVIAPSYDQLKGPEEAKCLG